MLEIILIDVGKEIKEELEKVLMNYDYNYKISNKYNNKNDNYKVYIIKCNNKFDEQYKKIQNIRLKENDWKSMIIVLTDNIKLKEYLYNEELMIISVIEKSVHYKEKLKNTFIKVLLNYDQHPNKIKYRYKNIDYIIDYQDIIYIEKEKDSKRSIIYTSDNHFYIQTTLSKLIKELDERFIKCSRSYIVNLEKMINYDKKNNIIQLKKDKKITEISRNKKSIIISYLRRVG